MGQNQHVARSMKSCVCKTCNQRKPIDTFVRKIGEYMGALRKYECIDCRVDRLYSDMQNDNPKYRPTREEKKGIRRAFEWLGRKV